MTTTKLTIDGAGGQAYRAWGHGYIEVKAGPNGLTVHLIDDTNRSYTITGWNNTLRITENA